MRVPGTAFDEFPDVADWGLELWRLSRAAEILQVPLEAMRSLESEWVAVDVGE